MDARIILAGQQPDLIGSLGRGIEAGSAMRQAQTQNRLADLYSQQGAGILSGDQNALNALAGIDPTQALQIQQSQQQAAMRARESDLGMRATQQRMEILSAQEQRAVQEYASGISAQQAAAEAAQLEEAVKMGMSIPDAASWDALMAQEQPELVGRFGEREALAAKFMTMAEILKRQQSEGQGFRPASPEEAAQYGAVAGQFGPDGRFYPVNQPRGTVIESTPGGGFRVVQGADVAKAGGPSIGQTFNPGDAKAAIDLIDSISENPNLDTVVGPIVGGGGNNIDELSMAERAYFGGEGTALIERMGQLQGKTWLAARDMLKGGGQITDYESKKAEGAVARLSRAKDPAEYRAALKELRDAIEGGLAKLQAAQGGGQPDISDADLLRMYGGE